MSETEIKVPNIGDFKDVEVIEVLVTEGQSIKKNDDHYGPLLVFIMGKIINTSVSAYQNINTNSSLEKAGIWKSKIPAYVNFIKKNTLKKMMPLQKKVYELDLAAKGLAGITKDQFWQEIDNMIIDLTSN